jgi:predicted DNA-binding transcriptional regulator AlpA
VKDRGDTVALVFRGKSFLSIPEAAEQLGVTRLTVYRWLRGTRRPPKPIQLDQVIRDTRSAQSYIPEATVGELRRALRKARSHAQRNNPRPLRPG